MEWLTNTLVEVSDHAYYSVHFTHRCMVWQACTCYEIAMQTLRRVELTPPERQLAHEWLSAVRELGAHS